MGQQLRIGIVFNPATPWQRHSIRGIVRYGDSVGGWHPVFLHVGGTPLGRESQRRVLDRIDGVISNNDLDLAEHQHVPLVATVQYGDRGLHPIVSSDTRLSGYMAADHLLQLGHRTLATFLTGRVGTTSAELRQEGFAARCAEAGVEPHTFIRGPRTTEREWTLDAQLDDLGDFLHALPKPVGLMAFDIEHAWRTLSACDLAGLRVPDDVSIISGGDDPSLFESLRPTLSGVAPDSERVGYEAAHTLHRMIRSEPVPPRTLIPPLGPVRRESTGRLATSDQVLNRAVRFIWDHVDRSLGVDEVVAHSGISHSSLSRRFRKHLGRTPQEEIRRSRVATARRLLLNTNLSLLEVAMRSGYAEQAQLSRAIRAETGLTPTQFRRHAGAY